MFILWLLSSSVWAAPAPSEAPETGSPYQDSLPFATREDAVSLSRSLRSLGCPSRVVRRFDEGAGWVHVVRAEAETLSSTCEAAMAGGREAPATEQRLPTTEERGAQERVAQDRARRPRSEELTPAAEEILARVLRRHRGPGGYEPPSRVVFRFRRWTPDGRVIDHLYARRGQDRHLRVDVVEGEGRSSRAGLVGGCVWADVHTADPLDEGAARDALERFSPEAVLGFPLSFAMAQPEIPAAEGFRVRRLEGPGRWGLDHPGDRSEPPSRLEVDEGSWEVAAWYLGPPGARVRWTFEAWRELERGALYPSRMVVEGHDRSLDDVEVQVFDTDPTFPEDWFPACPP